MIRLKVTGLQALTDKLNNISSNVQDNVDRALGDWAQRVEKEAKTLVQAQSGDNGNLARSISSESGRGYAKVYATAFYAAYIEFGTRKFASAYVSTLPQEWQDIAKTHKGSTGKSAGDMFDNILQWVIRKDITPQGFFTKKTKSGKNRVNKSQKEVEDKATAYVIMMSILTNGIKPRPFLYPSVTNQTPKLFEDLKLIFR